MTPILASRCALHSATRAAQWWAEPSLLPLSVARGAAAGRVALRCGAFHLRPAYSGRTRGAHEASPRLPARRPALPAHPLVLGRKPPLPVRRPTRAGKEPECGRAAKMTLRLTDLRVRPEKTNGFAQVKFVQVARAVDATRPAYYYSTPPPRAPPTPPSALLQ